MAVLGHLRLRSDGIHGGSDAALLLGGEQPAQLRTLDVPALKLTAQPGDRIRVLLGLGI
jgi:hypothetical protein